MTFQQKPDSNTYPSEKLNFNLGIKILTQSDRDLANIVARFGNPPQWQRKPGFPTLIQIILEQQVSLASAKATFNRLCADVDNLTPRSFLSLNDVQLKAIGFSRQKIRYGKGLANAIFNNQLQLDNLEKIDNLTIRNKLKDIKGIGDWTVDMYLIMALQRRNVFPSKDLAVATAVKEIKNFPLRPKPAELELIAEAWQPYRAIATQILWHYYLNRKQ